LLYNKLQVTIIIRWKTTKNNNNINLHTQDTTAAQCWNTPVACGKHLTA